MRVRGRCGSDLLAHEKIRGGRQAIGRGHRGGGRGGRTPAPGRSFRDRDFDLGEEVGLREPHDLFAHCRAARRIRFAERDGAEALAVLGVAQALGEPAEQKLDRLLHRASRSRADRHRRDFVHFRRHQRAHRVLCRGAQRLRSERIERAEPHEQHVIREKPVATGREHEDLPDVGGEHAPIGELTDRAVQLLVDGARRTSGSDSVKQAEKVCAGVGVGEVSLVNRDLQTPLAPPRDHDRLAPETRGPAAVRRALVAQCVAAVAGSDQLGRAPGGAPRATLRAARDRRTAREPAPRGGAHGRRGAWARARWKADRCAPSPADRRPRASPCRPRPDRRVQSGCTRPARPEGARTRAAPFRLLRRTWGT